MELKYNKEDEIIYKQIYDIVRLECRPKNFSEETPPIEYENICTKIFELRKSYGGILKITSTLYLFKTGGIGLPARLNDCFKVAEKIIKL